MTFPRLVAFGAAALIPFSFLASSPVSAAPAPYAPPAWAPEVNVDCGQTKAQIDAEVAVQVETVAKVKAARQYVRDVDGAAGAAYSQVLLTRAALRRAEASASKADDGPALRAFVAASSQLQSIQALQPVARKNLSTVLVRASAAVRKQHVVLDLNDPVQRRSAKVWSCVGVPSRLKVLEEGPYGFAPAMFVWANDPSEAVQTAVARSTVSGQVQLTDINLYPEMGDNIYHPVDEPGSGAILRKLAQSKFPAVKLLVAQSGYTPEDVLSAFIKAPCPPSETPTIECGLSAAASDSLHQTRIGLPAYVIYLDSLAVAAGRKASPQTGAAQQFDNLLNSDPSFVNGSEEGWIKWTGPGVFVQKLDGGMYTIIPNIWAPSQTIEYVPSSKVGQFGKIRIIPNSLLK